KTAAPTFVLPAGSYVVHVGFGLASATKAVQLRAGEPLREVFEIPAGGLRMEGKVGDAKIPPGQISFDLYNGSPFEPGDKRPIGPFPRVILAEGDYRASARNADKTYDRAFRVVTGVDGEIEVLAR